MSATESTMMKLGTEAPEFNLIEPLSGKVLGLNDLKSNIATVIIFICNHCPYVLNIADKLSEIAIEYRKKGISFIGINSNDVNSYPDDSPENMKNFITKLGEPYPYLFDETQEIAKAYNAACTPDLFVFDAKLKCVYRGQFDASRPKNNISPTGKDLTSALNATINGEPVNKNQIPSIGCNIKWK